MPSPQVRSDQTSRARKPSRKSNGRGNGATHDDEAVANELLDGVHHAEDFSELKAVLDRYCAFTTHLHHH